MLMLSLVVVNSLVIIVPSSIVTVALSVDSIGLLSVVVISSIITTVECDQPFLNQAYLAAQKARILDS